MMKDAMMTITKDKTTKTSIFYTFHNRLSITKFKKLGRRGYFAFGVFA